MLDDATDLWQKKTRSLCAYIEACVHARGGHFEQFLLHCLSEIQVATQVHKTTLAVFRSSTFLDGNSIPDFHWVN